MKDFNNLYKSYLKSIIKEDATESSENDGSMTLEELNAKYAGRTVVFKKLLWNKDAEERNIDPLKFVVIETKLVGIKAYDAANDQYFIKFSKANSLTAMKLQKYLRPLDIIKDELKEWESKDRTFDVAENDDCFSVVLGDEYDEERSF